MSETTPDAMRRRAAFLDARHYADALIASSTAEMLRVAADDLERLRAIARVSQSESTPNTR